MLHEFNIETSGHIVRKITPLYYEKYTYDEATGKAALQYLTTSDGVLIRHFYQKYSDVKNVYLKNIAFNGNLYNENHSNADEQGYVGMEDNGGYFIGGSYKFKGVSTQSGKLDFLAEMFKVAIGYIPLAQYIDFGVGDIINVIDMIASAADFAEDAKSNFRKEITNETDYSFKLTEILRKAQIDKYDHLLKDNIGVLSTPNTKDGVLFGIGGTDYAQNTFYYNFADETNMWNTGFVGRVKLDIVEENGNLTGSTVSPIATNIESNSYEKNLYRGEKLALEENRQKEVYALAGKACPISFTAPVNGTYTFETFGNVKNAFETTDVDATITDKADALNQKLVVDLKAGDVFDFFSKNISSENGIYKIKVEFTPTEITLGETKPLSIKAGETEYISVVLNNFEAINYALSQLGDFNTIVSIHTSDNIITTARMINKKTNVIKHGESGKYYIGVKNNTSNSVNISISISEIETISTTQEKTINVGHNALLKINSYVFDGIMAFNVNADLPIKASILDEKFDVIKTSEKLNDLRLACALQPNKIYYLLLRNENLQQVSANCSVDSINNLQNSDGIKISATDRVDVVNITKDNMPLANATAAMGVSYAILGPNNEYVEWEINTDNTTASCQKVNNNLVVNFDGQGIDKLIYINILNIKQGTLIAVLTTKFPYYANPSYNLDTSAYSIEVVDRNNIPVPVNGFNRMEVVVEEMSKTSNYTSVLLSEYLHLAWTSISSEVFFKVGEQEYSVYAKDVENIKRTFLSIDKISGILMQEGQVVIDMNNTGTNDKSITIPTSVTSLVFTGTTNSINIAFSFVQHDNFWLYLSNFNSISTNGTAVLDLSNIATAVINVEGTNSITGTSDTFLVKANNVTFSGTGSLRIIGNDGVNGADGGDGANATAVGAKGGDGGDGGIGTPGTSALYCTTLNKNGNCTITLQGGNGGSGGDGGDGGNGFVGRSLNPRKDSGNGGIGGSGGIGGNGGIGCNKESIYIEISNGYAGWGGNGGNGGCGADASRYRYIGGAHEAIMQPTKAGNGGNAGNAGINGVGVINTNITNKGQGGRGGDGGFGGDGAYELKIV